jgi:hypothetical protein
LRGPEENERPVRSECGNPCHQIEVDPGAEQAEETDSRTRDLQNRQGAGVLWTLGEVLVVHAVWKIPTDLAEARNVGQGLGAADDEVNPAD